MHKFNIKSLEKLDNPKRRQLMPPVETLKKFQIFDKGTFLDIGCGVGYFSIPATCVDANFAHLEDVFINLDHYGLKFKLI